MQPHKVSDFHFDLPQNLIAQSPPDTRGESRMLVVDRSNQTISHHTFSDITSFIQPQDVIVRNTTRVMRARLLGRRESGAPAEILLLKQIGEKVFEAMVHPGSKLRIGKQVSVSTQLSVSILSVTESGTRIVELHTDLSASDAIERYGRIPLPPYISRSDTETDADRYQTVYAETIGSVAAPTAGLHFTDEILTDLSKKDIITADVILHVGAGTFKPVDTDDPAEHVMHREQYLVPARTAATLNDARQRDNKIWAIGTTSVRTLESVVRDDGTFQESSGETGIFIYPPYKFSAVDHLLTNFHLARSTLLMLVSAFAGYELTMRAYNIAIENNYRFFSYGDAMLII